MTLYCLGRGVRVLIENLVCLRRESLQGLERRERVNDAQGHARTAGRKLGIQKPRRFRGDRWSEATEWLMLTNR